MMNPRAIAMQGLAPPVRALLVAVAGLLPTGDAVVMVPTPGYTAGARGARYLSALLAGRRQVEIEERRASAAAAARVPAEITQAAFVATLDEARQASADTSERTAADEDGPRSASVAGRRTARITQ